MWRVLGNAARSAPRGRTALQRAGLFILFGLAMLLAGCGDPEFTIVFGEPVDLSPGAVVVYRNIAVGEATDRQVTPTGGCAVRVRVEKSYRSVVRQGTHAVLDLQFDAGGTAVPLLILESSNANAPPLEPGSIIDWTVAPRGSVARALDHASATVARAIPHAEGLHDLLSLLLFALGVGISVFRRRRRLALKLALVLGSVVAGIASHGIVQEQLVVPLLGGRLNQLILIAGLSGFSLISVQFTLLLRAKIFQK